MTFYVTWKDPYPEAEFPVYSKFLDKAYDFSFDGIRFEADPATLDLNAEEKEFHAKGRTAMGHGYRVVGDDAPKKLLWPCGDRLLPDVIPATIPAYSKRLCDLIEGFEPGVHQFFPVDVYKAKDDQLQSTYYWFNVCNRLDSVDEQLTNYERIKDYTGRTFWSKTNVSHPRLVFSKTKIRDVAFWIDPNLPQTGPYCSDAFAEAAANFDFSGLSLSQRDEA